MGKRARVDGAAVAISVDQEGEQANPTQRRVIGATERLVVLRHGDGQLQLRDAAAFCKGGNSSGTARVVDLPLGVAFSPRVSTERRSVTWRNVPDAGVDAPIAVFLVDFCTAEVHPIPPVPLPEPIADAFVDATGQQMTLMGGKSGRLWGCHRVQSSTNWVPVDLATHTSQQTASCSSGRFIASAVWGSCFMYLRVTRTLVERWIFDVEASWTPISYSSRQLMTNVQSESSPTPQLFTSESWKFAAVAIHDTLHCVRLDQGLEDGSVQQIALDYQVLGGAWIDGEGGTLALLLANGHVSVVHFNDNKSFELLSIVTASTMSKRLSLSALLGKAVTTALQVVWVARERQLVVDFGTSCAAFNIELFDVGDPATEGTGIDKSGSVDFQRRFAASKRTVIAGLQRGTSNFGDCFRKRLEAATSPSTHELLDIARIALVRSCDRFEDLYFMLLCIIHQQLQGDLNGSEASTPDPIQCVSKSLKLMEMLLSLTISMSTPTLRQVGSKMLAAIPACAAKSDRKVYYRKEIHTLSRCVSDMLSDSNEAEDWRMLSTEVEAFLQVYYVRIAALLPDMNSSCEQSGANTAISFFQLLMDQEDEAVFREAENAVARMSARDSGEECGGSPFDVLILMTASYAMMCRFLQVSGVVVDLEHWLSATTSIRGPRRKQVLRCFLKPWVPAFGDERSIASQSNVTSGWTLEAAVKYAGRSGALHLLVDFCLASGSHLTHKCLQEVCKAAKHRANLTQDVSIEAMPNVRGGVNDLHFQVCEAYLSELMAISRHLGPVRPFKHPIREAQASAGRLSRPFSIDHEFDVYLKQLSAELNGEEREKNGAGNQKSPLWMFVSQDERRLARGFRLLSCIVWHVEYVQEATAGGFERTFMADLIDEHLGAGESEGKMIRDFIIKAQEAISSGSLVKDQLRLFKGQQSVGNSHTNFPSRLEKITRSLVLAAWALWMREKTAYCVRSIHLGRQGAGPIRGQSASSRVVDIAELEVVGALAATCALQLGGLCVIYSSETDLFSVQLSLLEDAAKMNPDKTAAVICWGFPADKVQTRYLKRYKALRQVVKSQQTSENPALKEREQQCQFLQKHVKRSVYSRARPHSGEGSASVVAEPKRSCHVDVGVLMNCCCNGEFQQLIATLVKVTCKGAPAAVPADSSSQREDKSVTVKMDVQLEPSSPERLISRDEVMTLLQEQTRQLEEKIRTLTATADQRSHNEPLIVEPAVAPVHATVKEVTSQIAPKTLVQKHLCVRDLVSRRHSPADAGSDAQAKLLNDTAPLPVQRQDSVRNALKLFRLRQENSGHAQQKSDAPLKDGATKSSLPGENTIVKPDVKDGSDARKQPRTLRTEPRHLKPSTSTERRSKKHPNDREGAVFPLRFESGLDNLSLTLLGRSPHCRNPPVRGRQYVHHKPERLPLKSQHYPEAKNVSFDSSSAEFVHLKTTGAQTNLLDESSHSGDQPRPEEGSPLAQETSAQHQCQDEAKAPAQGVATQCRMGEETQSKPGRGTRAPPLLSIADKFPIYVDLDGAAFTGNRYKERKRFLQVARFAGPSPTKGSDQAANNEATEEAQPLFLAPSARPVLVSRNLESECGNEENQSDDQPSSLVDLALDREEWETEQQEVTAKYQASYRKHFPTEPPQNKLKTDREVAGGIESLLGLRDNMQRMTQRLRALETCANSIDDEFKASHQRLDRIEDNRLGGISLKERVLENVDAVLATTETRDEIPTTGILSKKASSDLAAAKKLLETIEQLAIEGADEERGVEEQC